MLKCEACGSNDLKKVGEYLVCSYCGSKIKFDTPQETTPQNPPQPTQQIIKINVPTQPQIPPVRPQEYEKPRKSFCSSIFIVAIFIGIIVGIAGAAGAFDAKHNNGRFYTKNIPTISQKL